MLSLRRLIKIFFFFFFVSCKEDEQNKKNFIIILADDLGYSDLSSFGSEINTPNIDLLAKDGIIMTNFHTSPSCAPSRAMLLSGNDNHIAGIGIQAYNSDNFGYEGKISDRVNIIPEILGRNGYNSFISGKWHIGGDPIDRGFDNSFSLLPGAFTHYDNNKPIKAYPDSSFSDNGKKVLWPDGKYSSDFYTDKMIDFIQSNSKKPFFAYLSYTAPHWPLQVDDFFSDKYKGYYDKGYYDILEKRLLNNIESGIIKNTNQFPDMEYLISDWRKLDSNEKKIESRKMEVYAGMIENLDYNIGRLVKYLKSENLYDNTIIFFMSDNGAAAEDFYYNQTYGGYIREKFSYELDEIGSPNSFVSLGKNWAKTITYPFRLYKGFTTSGGLRSPLIIKGLKNDVKISDEFITILDIAPTIYDMTGSEYIKIKNYDLKGSSILPYVKGFSVKIHSDDYVFSFEHSGNSVLRKGSWKIINKINPFDKKNLELFHVDDFMEQNNVRENNIEIFDSLYMDWDNYVKATKIILPTPYIDDLN
ncbi:MAG: sulfatase [Flammeovirgaceae bacterium]|nr:sulfatase [Flammeovirgaceae bacterium]